jgi:hypothetical protein
LSTVYVTFYDLTGKWISNFYCPLKAKPNIEEEDDVSWNITVGSERWPSFDCTSVQESAYRLRLATAAHLGTDVSSIPAYRYRNDRFIIGQSFEKAPGQSSHTGINTRSGSQLCINVKNMDSAAMIHVVMHYEQIINMSAAGVEVLD